MLEKSLMEQEYKKVLEKANLKEKLQFDETNKELTPEEQADNEDDLI